MRGNDRILMVASDRISAFDVVMNEHDSTGKSARDTHANGVVLVRKAGARGARKLI